MKNVDLLNEVHVLQAAINNNLTSIKNKLETELSTAQADLDEVTKELHAADERANRALSDAARAVEQLHEEQEHSMKIDALRKSLEEQVKQLQVQIQEAEAAALLGGKRVIAKLETRIRDLETALDEETRRYINLFFFEKTVEFSLLPLV